jgi:hypothetical protein
MTALSVTITIFTIFITGIVAGAIGLVSVAVHREERNHTLKGPAPDHIARAARRLTGLYVRAPDAAREMSAPSGARGIDELIVRRFLYVAHAERRVVRFDTTMAA